jgi:hypothetical protein
LTRSEFWRLETFTFISSLDGILLFFFCLSLFSSLVTLMSQDYSQALQALRKELFEDGILRDGDSVGTDDETLL